MGTANCDAQARELVTHHQQGMRQGGPDWSALADALDKVLAGERAPAMAEQQGSLQTIILETILQGIADPAGLQDLLQQETAAPSNDNPLAALPEQLRQLVQIIAASVQQPELRPQLEPLWQQPRDQGGGALVDAVQALYAGQTYPTALLEGLGEEEQRIFAAVLWQLQPP